MRRVVPGRYRTPLVLQILSLLFTGLIVAQLVTLLLTLVMPPAPPVHHNLADIAAALRNGPAEGATLDRAVQGGPPDISGRGWLVSEQSRAELAAMLKVPAADISLAFFTPLPFAGTAASPRPDVLSFEFVGTAYAQTPAVVQQPVVPPSGQSPTFGTGPGPGGAGGRFPGGVPGGGRHFGRGPDRQSPNGTEPPASGAGRPGNHGLFDIGGPTSSSPPVNLPGDGSGAVPPIFGQRPGLPGGGRPLPAPIMREMAGPADSLLQSPLVPVEPGALVTVAPLPMLAPVSVPVVVSSAAAFVIPVPTVPVAAPAVPILAPAITPAVAPAPMRPIEPAIPLNHTQTSIFGTAPAPFVEGDFVAAWRTGPGRWIVVQPRAEAFPSAWQRRLLLWFSLSFLLVLPLGWMFARRIVKPLSAFANAAEQLGRDPAPVVLEIHGPAEVGRAAHAFNVMQARLKSFVDDRTAMVGAISHDLRTPLTRLRFRIEEIEDDDWRDGMTGEVVEMEAMISSVLAFIRDASTPGARQRIDLRTILEDVVGSANRTGNAVTLETTQAVLVDVDPLAMRRIFGNLIDNATKYGGAARIRLSINDGDALAEVIDDGPGMPDDEIEQAFQPFYRSLAARNSSQAGSGLGLAVCRSIARAHGGDVQLVHARDGFTARLNVPLAFAA